MCNEIYIISVQRNLSKDFRFSDQINAASGSIMDNIAEGFDRGGRLELINFLTIAKGSASEVKLKLYRILDRKYISPEKSDQLYKLAAEIEGMIGSRIGYLNKSEIKGHKIQG